MGELVSLFQRSFVSFLGDLSESFLNGVFFEEQETLAIRSSQQL